MNKVIGISIVIFMVISSVGISVSSEEAVPAFPPVAIANGPESAKIYKEINFDSSKSYDRNGKEDIVSYVWDFDIHRDSNNDGIPDNDVDSDEIKPTYSYDYSGKYKVKLTVIDSAGLKDEDILEISIGFDQKNAVIMVGRYFGWLNLNPLAWGPPDWPNLKTMSNYYKWNLNEAGRLYTQLREELGFKDENIHLLVKTIEPIEIDGQTFFKMPKYMNPNWIDDTSSEDILATQLNSINKKMNEDDCLFLNLIGHGGNDQGSTYLGCPFYEIPDFVKYIFEYLRIPNPWDGDTGQRLWDSELGCYVSGNKGTCIFALQPCYSGGFISELSGEQRIICTSAREDQFADSWISGFRKALTAEGSVADAYEAGVAHANYIIKSKPEENLDYDPLIDDNSDNFGSYLDEKGYNPKNYGKDGYLASRTFLGIKLDSNSSDENILPINEEVIVTEITTKDIKTSETSTESTEQTTNEDTNQDNSEGSDQNQDLPPDEEQTTDPVTIVSITPNGAVTVEEGEKVDFTLTVTGGSGNNHYTLYGGDGNSVSGYMGDAATIPYTYNQAGSFEPDVELYDMDTSFYDTSMDFALVTVAENNNQNNPI